MLIDLRVRKWFLTRIPNLIKHRKTRSVPVEAKVEEHIAEALKEDAQEKQITASTLVNGILGLNLDVVQTNNI
jgi:hypothetical protein